MFLILDQRETEFSLGLQRIAECKGLKTLLLTSADVARDTALAFHLTEEDCRLELGYQTIAVESSHIQGVYCGINLFEPALWDRFEPEDAAYAARETQGLWLAILASLPCRVINPPALDTLAGTFLSTPEILSLAHRLGFHIPTAITLESGQTAAELLKKGIPARYADLGETYAHEESLSRDDLGHLARNEDHFRVLEEVPGRPVSLALLGKTIFACGMDARGSVAPLPAWQIPRFVRSRLSTLHQELHLTLAEYAFRVMTDGTWVFLGSLRPPIVTLAAYGDALLGNVIDYAVGKGE